MTAAREPSVPGLYASRIARIAARFGEVPPLWAWYPRVHPYDIHWRMGGGEDYRYLFWAWVDSRVWTTQDRIAFIRRWSPPPSWLEWSAWFLWPDEFSDEIGEVSEEQFARLEALGLGSQRDCIRCMDVDADSYPLPDDVSQRWLERGDTLGLMDP
jgi:hypothetical protein